MNDQNDALRHMMGKLGLIGELDMLTQQSIKTSAPGGAAPPREYSTILPPANLTRCPYVASFATNRNPVSPAGMKTLLTSCAPAIEHGVAQDIATLRPINLREIAQRVNAIHQDRVLFAKVAHAPYRMTGANVLLEDTQGDVILCGLYNYVMPSEDPADLLPAGCFVALLAPYMHNARDDRMQELMLRCDNPQWVITFDSEAAWLAAREGRDPPVETTETSDLRKNGNDAFKNGKLKQSIRLYTRALNHPSISLEDKVACLGNRAEAYLREEQWEYAASDCEEVIQIEKNHVKANFRLSKALLRLGQAAKAEMLLKVVTVPAMSLRSSFKPSPPSALLSAFAISTVLACPRARLWALAEENWSM